MKFEWKRWRSEPPRGGQWLENVGIASLSIRLCPQRRSSDLAEPEKYLSLAADDAGLAGGFLDFAEWINPTDLAPEYSLTHERRDFAEQQKGRGN
jgi:hypothetical protein